MPFAPNSGQYSTTGASTSSVPACASWFAHTAVMPFVVEKTRMIESSSHGRPVVDVRDAAPEVHDLLAAVVRGERRADLLPLGEVARERVAHALEAGCGPTV